MQFPHFYHGTVTRFHEQRPIAGDEADGCADARSTLGVIESSAPAGSRIRFLRLHDRAWFLRIRLRNAGAVSNEIVRVRRGITKLGMPDQHAPYNRFISGLICWWERETHTLVARVHTRSRVRREIRAEENVR